MIPQNFAVSRNNFAPPIFDRLMVCFAKTDRSAITRNADAIREALIDLSFSDGKFIDYTTRSTSDTKVVIGRFKIWERTLDEILSQESTNPRCFSRALKEEFFKNNPACAICGQRISDIDDAAMDHIKQYWLGGETIPENARLVHRHCNNIRPRKE